MPIAALLFLTLFVEIHYWFANLNSSKFARLAQLYNLMLVYFDPSQPVKLSVDTSSKGLGAVVFQNNHPIAYALRALTDTQQ